MKIYYVNAFVSEGMEGNPAGVVVSYEKLDEKQMLAIAKGVGFSETAFLYLDKEKQLKSLRWFSPTTEVALCGHATLATADVYFQKYAKATEDSVEFTSSYGILKCSKRARNILIEFPKDVISSIDKDVKIVGLNINPASIKKVLWAEKNRYLIVVLSKYAGILALKPNEKELLKLNQQFEDIRGLMVTKLGETNLVPKFRVSREGLGSDCREVIHSRFFDPWEGILEDPVTGSAHVAMAAYWFSALNCDKFTAKQLSRRGGCIKVINGEECIKLLGKSEIVSEKNIKAGEYGN